MPLALFLGVNLGTSNTLLEAFLFAVISAVLSEALVFFALSRGELSITATILASYSIYTVIFSFIINGERLSFYLLTAVVVAIFGTLMATLPRKIRKSELRIQPKFYWPLIAAVAIGFSDTLSKGYINRSNDYSLLMMIGLVQIPIAFTYLKIEKQTVRVLSG